jgi:hypothetical protein
MITYLHEFATTDDLSQLSAVFLDDERLTEAAELTRKMMSLIQELISARERAGGAEDEVPKKRSNKPSQQQVELTPPY